MSSYVIGLLSMSSAHARAGTRPPAMARARPAHARRPWPAPGRHTPAGHDPRPAGTRPLAMTRARPAHARRPSPAPAPHRLPGGIGQLGHGLPRRHLRATRESQPAVLLRRAEPERVGEVEVDVAHRAVADVRAPP